MVYMFSYQYILGSIRTPNAPGGVLSNGEAGLVGNCCNASNHWTNCGSLGADRCVSIANYYLLSSVSHYIYIFNLFFRTPVYNLTGPSPLGNVRSPASFYNWFVVLSHNVTRLT